MFLILNCEDVFLTHFLRKFYNPLFYTNVIPSLGLIFFKLAVYFWRDFKYFSYIRRKTPVHAIDRVLGKFWKKNIGWFVSLGTESNVSSDIFG